MDKMLRSLEEYALSFKLEGKTYIRFRKEKHPLLEDYDTILVYLDFLDKPLEFDALDKEGNFIRFRYSVDWFKDEPYQTDVDRVAHIDWKSVKVLEIT